MSGTIRVPKIGRTNAKTYRLKTLRQSIAEGAAKKRKIALRLSTTTTRAARHALKARKRIIVKLRITVADAAGNKRTFTRQVRLTR